MADLCSLELHLLHPSLPYHKTLIPKPHPNPTIQTLIQSIHSGQYTKTLITLNPNSSLFHINLQNQSIPISQTITNCIKTYLISHNNDGVNDRVLLVFTVAVAAFLGFVQTNVTGPLVDLPLLFGDMVKEDIEIWARNEVMSPGSDLLGKFVNLEYLVYAKVLLMVVRDYLKMNEGKGEVGFVTCSWWLVRILLVEQKILDGHSSVLFEKLGELCSECLDNLGDLEKVGRYWDGVDEGVLSDVVAMVHLECGIVDFRYGRVDSAKLKFEVAQKVSGLRFEVSGAMGFRTVHQVDPKAQLCLIKVQEGVEMVTDVNPLNLIEDRIIMHVWTTTRRSTQDH